MKKWSEVRAKLPEETRARLDARLQEAIASMPLDKIRKAQKLTQTALAERMQMDQGGISKIENRPDMYLSTLRQYIEAMGGSLELRADFPEGSFAIDLTQQ